ncbi:MAG: hypothetical protein ACRDLZ_06695 [Gaiellaceae bacterium]
MQGVTVLRTLPMRRGRIGAVLAGALVFLLAAGCGGGDGGGGEEEDTGELAAQAAAVGTLLDEIEALPTTAATADEFSTQLAPIREQIDVLVGQIQETSAPEGLASQQSQLSNRLVGLKTQLGRVQGLLASGDLEGANAATEGLISIRQLRQTIAAIEGAA